MPYPVAAVRNKNFINSVTPRLIDSVPAGAIMAFSVARKLSNSYNGNCLRLRRSSDNAESNFGFDILGDLDSAAITAWLSGANPFITTLYDQSGQGNNLTQASASSQPAFTIAGANGKPTITFDGGDDFLEKATFQVNASATACVVAKSINTNGKYVFDLGAGVHSIIHSYNINQWEWYSSPRTQIGTLSTSLFQTIITNLGSTINAKVGLGGYITGPSDFWPGLLSEAIAWNSAFSVGDQGIVSANQGAYYGY